MAEAYFAYLKPTSDTSDAAIAKYQTLLDDVRKENADNTFLIDKCRDAMTDLRQMQKGQEMSRKYLAGKQ